ncbi:autoinducer binding domain-containing protein [Myxococcus fulvus]|uniref:autoinducer binding domain-containing protein n=1 Tax=Myxococcus fulvus TaxID=33 RepID=UPI003B9A4C61
MAREEVSGPSSRREDDAQALFEPVDALARTLGFDFCGYLLRMPWPVSHPAVATFDSYPPGWMAHYRQHDYLRIDPVVRLGANSTELVVWSDELFAQAPRLREDARAFGLASAVAQSCWAAHGVFGLLTFARASPEPLSDEALEALRQPMLVTAHQLHARMMGLLVPRLAPDVDTALTPREREVLLWTGEGKTSADISTILDISERTVNFHIGNALLKLNATNKVQAVVKALTLGLMDAG